MRKPPAATRAARSYEDFDLRVEAVEGGYRARAHCRLVGEGENRFPAPFSPADLAALDRQWAALARGAGLLDDPGHRLPQDLGGRLFEAVFAGPVLARWSACHSLLAEGQGLRLRLKLKDPEIAAWPWEYLFDPGGKGFLALSEKTPVVRYEDLPAEASRLAVATPLCVLVVAPEPRDLPALQGGREWELLNEALSALTAAGHVVLERVQPATRRELERWLDRPEPCHVLHIAGHGHFDGGRADGVIQMETEDGRADPYEGTALATALSDHGVPRLVFLNICDGARGSCGGRSAGLAQSLVRHQVPAVVAMREQISDEAALVFARSFYERLAAGAPVDAALSRARREMQSAKHWTEWGTPVLYMRSEDGTLVGAGRSVGGKSRWLLAAGVLLAAALVAGVWSLQDRAASVASKPGPAPVLRPLDPTDPRCPSPPGLGLSFAYVEPGSFRRGEGKEAQDVILTRPYCLGRYEVTKHQWNAILGDGTRSLLAAPDNRLPAEGKSWEDAVALVNQLRDLDPEAGFRMPSEAEWEYGARAGSKARFSFGDDVELLRRYGNCDGNEDRYKEVAPVGVFEPNGWGLYDMQGNVWEWVQDRAGPYQGTSVKDPTGAETGTRRIRRGGSWDIKPANCGVAKRTDADPARNQRDVGLRLVRDPVPPPVANR